MLRTRLFSPSRVTLRREDASPSSLWEHDHPKDNSNDKAKYRHAHNGDVKVGNGKVAKEEEWNELPLANDHDRQSKAKSGEYATHDLEGVEKNVRERCDEGLSPISPKVVDDSNDREANGKSDKRRKQKRAAHDSRNVCLLGILVCQMHPKGIGGTTKLIYENANDAKGNGESDGKLGDMPAMTPRGIAIVPARAGSFGTLPPGVEVTPR